MIVRNCLIFSGLILVFYILSSIHHAEQKAFPFIIELPSQILCSLINNIIYIFVFIPVHSFRLLLISFPQYSNDFICRYNADFKEPFSRLFPQINQFLYTHFPLFEVPPDLLQPISSIYLISNRFPYLTLFMKYLFLGLLAFLVLYLLRNKIIRLSNSNFIRIWASLFVIFIVLQKWIEINGPLSQKISNMLDQVTNFHFTLFCNIIDFFNFLKEKVSCLFGSNEKVFSEEQTAKEIAFNLYEKVNTAFTHLIHPGHKYILYKIRLIRSQPFDALFIFFIVTLLWSAALYAVLLLYFHIIDEKRKTPAQGIILPPEFLELMNNNNNNGQTSPEEAKGDLTNKEASSESPKKAKGESSKKAQNKSSKKTKYDNTVKDDDGALRNDSLIQPNELMGKSCDSFGKSLVELSDDSPENDLNEQQNPEKKSKFNQKKTVQFIHILNTNPQSLMVSTSSYEITEPSESSEKSESVESAESNESTESFQYPL